MDWIKITDETKKQLKKGESYMCFVPNCKKYNKHYDRYHFDGENFRDRQAFFGNDKIVEASHYMIVTEPEKKAVWTLFGDDEPSEGDIAITDGTNVEFCKCWLGDDGELNYNLKEIKEMYAWFNAGEIMASLQKI